MSLKFSKKQFEHALVELDCSKKKWIEKHGISYEWLRQVLNQEAHSSRIEGAIVETIKQAKNHGEMDKYDNLDSLGERISFYLKRVGKKHYELAEYCKTDPPHVSKWVNNKVIPSAENIRRIADFCGISINQLLGDEKQIKTNLFQKNRLSVMDKKNPDSKPFYDEIESIIEFIKHHLVIKAALTHNRTTLKQAEINFDQDFEREMAILRNKLNSLPLFLK